VLAGPCGLEWRTSTHSRSAASCSTSWRNRRCSGASASSFTTAFAVEVTPERWRSWTGSVLHEQTQKALAVAYADAWLPDDG